MLNGRYNFNKKKLRAGSGNADLNIGFLGVKIRAIRKCKYWLGYRGNSKEHPEQLNNAPLKIKSKRWLEIKNPITVYTNFEN